MSADPSMLTNVHEGRARHDAYFSERWCTEALIRACPWIIGRGMIWEPAAGAGDIVIPLREAGADVRASDIVEYGFPLDMIHRFEWTFQGAASNIITNPPYDRAQEWCERALEITRGLGFVCMLLRNEFDCAKTRRHLFRDHPAFAVKVVLTKRPRWHWPGKTEDTASPRHNYAWYVWDWAAEPVAPVILYEGAA